MFVLLAVRRYHFANFELVLLREGEVPLVVAGDGHDRAGPVRRQDVVGDPDRDALAGEDVAREGPGVHAGLLAYRRRALDLRHVPRGLDVTLDLGAPGRRGDLRDERMFRRQDHEDRAIDRVRPRGEEAELLTRVAFDRECELGPLLAAVPVRL